MALPTAWTDRKPHSFPPPCLWPGCPARGMPSRLWNRALVPGARHGKRGRVHQSPHGGGGRRLRSTTPRQGGKFGPTVPPPNPYSKRAPETQRARGKPRERETRAGIRADRGGAGGASLRGCGGRERWRATSWLPRCAQHRSLTRSPGPRWVRPSGLSPSDSSRQLRGRQDSRLKPRGEGQEALPRPPVAPPLCTPRPRPARPRPRYKGGWGAGGGRRLSQWQGGRRTKKPMGASYGAGGVGPGAGPGAGPGGSGDSSGIAKGAGCWGRPWAEGPAEERGGRRQSEKQSPGEREEDREPKRKINRPVRF